MAANRMSFVFLINTIFFALKLYDANSINQSISLSKVPLDHDSDQLDVHSESLAVYHQCDQIDAIFNKSENRACRCFDGVPDFDNLNLDAAYPHSDQSVKGQIGPTVAPLPNSNSDGSIDANGNKSLFGKIWIGCTKSNFPSINHELTSLPENIVLSKLWLWDNMIGLIFPTIFSKVRTEKLIFENNRLFELSQGRLVLKTTAPYLRHLIIRNNAVKYVNSEIFQDLANLRTLDLSYNDMSSLDENSLGGGMPQLRYLSFEGNRISALEGAVFAYLGRLENLNLATNRLLDLGNRSTFVGLQNLRFLNLANNRLMSLPDWLFDDASNLHVLNLGNNSLSKIDANINKLRNLRRLYLNSNFFTVLPQFNMPNLQVLNVDSNSISELTADWSKFLGSLKLLSLASNQIQSVLEPQLFTGLTNLSVLSLQNNSISAIKDEAFGFYMPSLQKLVLSDNQLGHLSSKSFKGLEKLQVLNLARNNLQEILHAEILIGLNHLQRFHVNRNKLKILDQKFLKALLSVKYVDLAENPWQCDCTTLNFSKWVESHAEKLVSLEETLCQLSGRSDILLSEFHALTAVRQECFDRKIVGSGNGPDEGHGPSGVHKITGNSQGTNSTWITVLAFILAISSVLFLLAVAYLLLKDASALKKATSISQSVESNLNAKKSIKKGNLNYGKTNGNFLQRFSSDMVHLISTAKTSSVTAPLLVVNKSQRANDTS